MPALLKQLRVLLLAAAGVWLVFQLGLVAVDLTSLPNTNDWQWSLASHFRLRSASSAQDTADTALVTPQQLCILGTAGTREDVEEFMAEWADIPSMWAVLLAAHNSSEQQQTTDTLAAVEVLTSSLSIRHTRLSSADSGLSAAASDFSSVYASVQCEYFVLCEATIRFELLSADSSGWTAARDTLVNITHQHVPPAVIFSQPPDECPSATADSIPITSGRPSPLVIHRSLIEFLFPKDWTGNGQFVGSETAISLVQSMYPHSAIAAGTVFRTTRRSHECLEAVASNAQHRSNGSSSSTNSVIQHASKVLHSTLTPSYATTTSDIGGNTSPAHASHRHNDFLALLNDAFDILHPYIVSHPWVSSHHTLDSLRMFRASGCNPQLTLLVFTLNRLTSLQRLLQSVLASDYSGWQKVELHIHVDYSDVQHDITSYLDSFSWPFGGLVRKYANVSIGLRDSILSAWQPETLDDFAVFLEDDIEVSPQFAVWARVAVLHYYYSIDRPLRESPLMGVSLYMPVWTERVDKPFWVDPTFPVYGMQAPSSWGAVYFPHQWTSFCRWQRAHAHTDPLVPGLAGINSWSMENSWKKYLIRYMVEQGYFMLYPNRIDGLSFSTNHAEAGTNVFFSSEWKKVLDARFNVPLVPSNDNEHWYQRHSAVLFGTMRVIDIFDQPVKLTEQLRVPVISAAAWQAYSRLTIAVPLESASSASQAAVIASLQHWQDLSVLQELVVQASARLNFTCPLLRVRCAVNRNTMSSVDNYLWRIQHQSASVLLLSPQVRLPLSDVEDMFHVWQRHPDQVVSIANLTRSYRVEHAEYVAWTDPLPQLTLVSSRLMLLATQFLDMYWSDERPFHNIVRQSVWQRGRGEDVAIMRLITNVTGRWPAVLNRAVSGSVSDLWHEPTQQYKEDLGMVRQGYGEDWPWLNGRTLHFMDTAWAGMYHLPDSVAGDK